MSGHTDIIRLNQNYKIGFVLLLRYGYIIITIEIYAVLTTELCSNDVDAGYSVKSESVPITEFDSSDG